MRLYPAFTFHGGRKPGKEGEGLPSVTPQSLLHPSYHVARKEIEPYSLFPPPAIKSTNVPGLNIKVLLHLQC